MSTSRRSVTSTSPKQATNGMSQKSGTSTPALKSASGLSQTTSRSIKSRASLKSSASRRSPSPNLKNRPQSTAKKEELIGNNVGDEIGQENGDHVEADKHNGFVSENIVEEEPAQEQNQLVL